MLRKQNKIAQHILAEKGKVHTNTQAVEMCLNHNKPWQEIGKEKKYCCRMKNLGSTQ